MWIGSAGLLGAGSLLCALGICYREVPAPNQPCKVLLQYQIIYKIDEIGNRMQ